jgi:DNA modification methylase
MQTIKLTDNEIRDITKYLESGKPLPEKYRFLLFEDKREVELVWNGKTSDVCKVVLPFQVIEQVDEPRAEGDADAKKQASLFDFDVRGRQIKGWTNKLIWGDNKLILSSLKNGPLREQIEAEGGIKLIYIDPPFDVGADFSMNIEIGDEQFTKQPSVLEELAYRDTWGKGADSFIAMIYERLSLMRDLLAKDGSIYVHCDWRLNSFMRLVLDEIFGKENFFNEIAWCYRWYEHSKSHFNRKKDNILFYAKDKKSTIFNWKDVTEELEEASLKKFKYIDEKGRKYCIRGKNRKGSPVKQLANLTPEQEKQYPDLTYRQYLDENEGVKARDWWIIDILAQGHPEIIGYPTQKPEKLLEKIIKASSSKNDIICDFFCGSGTTLAVAEKFGRKWIGSDLGKFAIHTTRKRIITVQRELKKKGKDYRAFEILNLGKYERQYYIGVNHDLREEEKQKQLAKKEKDFVALILLAYKAQPVEGFSTFHGKKSSRLVAIGPINLPVSRLFIEAIIDECLKKKITKVDMLAFEFEMGLFPKIQEDAKAKGIDLALKYIPRDVFDKRAIEKNQIVFHDVAYIEVKPIVKKNSIAIELTDFSVFYNQDSIANVEESLKNGGNKIVVESGSIIKISKNKDGLVKREVLTKNWTDWIDYWAVDFDFENKKEIIRVKNEQGEIEEVWTGDYIFENEWQSFRTKKNRKLELISVASECSKGRRKVAVKVVDIFGNDTMKVIDINV